VDSFPGFRQHRLRQYSNSSRLSARNDARGWFHHEAPRAAKPQPKSKYKFHHEGREEHEGKNKYYRKDLS
jgi:hypothetical protein